VDYIALIGEQHDRQIEGPVNYHALMPPAGPPASGQEQEQDGRGAGGEDGRG
jgi:hypothetical protein